MATFTFGDFPVRLRTDDVYINAIYALFPTEGVDLLTPGRALIGWGMHTAVRLAGIPSLEDDPTFLLSVLSGANRVSGGSANDLLPGFAGTDTLLGNTGADSVVGGDGTVAAMTRAAIARLNVGAPRSSDILIPAS